MLAIVIFIEKIDIECILTLSIVAGERQANINIADGRKSSVILASEGAKVSMILASEGAKMDQVNRAQGKLSYLLYIDDGLVIT